MSMKTDLELTKKYWRTSGENPPPGQKVLDAYAVYRRGRKVTVQRDRLTEEELTAISAGLHEAGERAFREADNQELVFEILKPFFVTEETKTFEALDMIDKLVSKKLKSRITHALECLACHQVLNLPIGDRQAPCPKCGGNDFTLGLAGPKSPLQLADEFVAEHYPAQVDPRIRTHYIKLFSERLRPN